MSYYLEVPHFIQRFITVNIPAPTTIGGYNFEIEFSCQLTATDLILNGTTNASSNNVCFLKASALEYRNSPSSNISMTHGVNASEWHVYRLVFTGSGAGNIAFYVDGVFKDNYTPSASIATPEFTALLHLSSATRTGNFRYFKFTDFNNTASNRMYDARAHVPGDLVLRETVNGQDGSFSDNSSAWAARPPSFIADTPVVTPIAFTGTIPAQTFTEGDSVDVDLTGYFSGTETPFTYANTGTALTGTGLSVSTSGVLVGTATVGSSAAVVITGTDTGANTASSNTFSITVNDIPDLPPQGITTIGTIIVGETTAQIPFNYSLADQTGFVYRLNGTGSNTVTENPISLTGLSSGSDYDIEVAAINSAGTGTWSSISSFTTEDAPATDPLIVFDSSTALVYNTGVLRADETDFTVFINNVTTNELYTQFTGVSTDSSGLIDSLQSINLPTAGTSVRVTVLASDGAECVFRETTQ